MSSARGIWKARTCPDGASASPQKRFSALVVPVHSWGFGENLAVLLLAVVDVGRSEALGGAITRRSSLVTVVVVLICALIAGTRGGIVYAALVIAGLGGLMVAAEHLVRHLYKPLLHGNLDRRATVGEQLGDRRGVVEADLVEDDDPALGFGTALQHVTHVDDPLGIAWRPPRSCGAGPGGDDHSVGPAAGNVGGVDLLAELERHAEPPTLGHLVADEVAELGTVGHRRGQANLTARLRLALDHSSTASTIIPASAYVVSPGTKPRSQEPAATSTESVAARCVSASGARSNFTARAAVSLWWWPMR